MAGPSSLPGERSAHAATITSGLLIGSWNAVAADAANHQPGELDLYYSEGHRSAAVHAVEHRVEWIICGLGLGDQELSRVVSGVRAVHPGIRVAVLGDSEDWRRCEAWLRRGCQVYLDADSDFSRMVAAIVHAHTYDLTIADTVFQQSLAVRRAVGVPELTPREFDVLERLKQGLMNREIAEILHITENTVEYHLKNLFQKLGARNRLEVIERATSLGI